VTGGGSQGWRTFSIVPNITGGAWRVNVELPTGALIGQLRFDVAVATTTPLLVPRK
jgi:hypothetical protein